jgi:DNA-binding NarL/FixJ family response regulator
LKRILVVHGENLLISGVESLLTHESDLTVMGVRNSSRSYFLQEVNQFHPHVIILDESSLLSDLTFLHYLLKNCPDLRVIVIDEGDNLIHIYEKRVVSVAQGTDLINVIRADHNDGAHLLQKPKRDL